MARPRSRVAGNKPFPFSLILQPEELRALRRIARKEGISAGAVVRRAIHTVIYRVHPDVVNRMIESEVDGFLDQLAQGFSFSLRTSAKRRAF